ncbi:MAG: hypothetical protein IPQ06_00195 [Chitinophagaceae bacterium]|nr:hypothetical protein [Chitinophagaceae bacterium]
MNHLLKLLPISVCILFIFSGCSKPSDYSSDYIKGKIDGVGFECIKNIKANKPEPIPGQGSDPTLIITGEWSGYSIRLLINSEGTSIGTGTYVFQGGKNRSATIWQNNVDAYYAGNGGFFNSGALYGSGKITILEISNKYIRGTFDFITDVNGVTGTFKTVTDGTFLIKRG